MQPRAAIHKTKSYSLELSSSIAGGGLASTKPRPTLKFRVRITCGPHTRNRTFALWFNKQFGTRNWKSFHFVHPGKGQEEQGLQSWHAPPNHRMIKAWCSGNFSTIGKLFPCDEDFLSGKVGLLLENVGSKTLGIGKTDWVGIWLHQGDLCALEVFLKGENSCPFCVLKKWLLEELNGQFSYLKRVSNDQLFPIPRITKCLVSILPPITLKTFQVLFQLIPGCNLRP